MKNYNSNSSLVYARLFTALCFFSLTSSAWSQIHDTDFGQFRRQVKQITLQKGSNHPEIKHLKRNEWYQQYRLGSHGKMVNIDSFRLAAVRAANIQYRAQRTEETEIFSANWAAVGPSNVTGNNGIGRVNRIGFHPTNVNILFAATAGGGLWKTINQGSTWSPLTDGIPNLSLSGVVIHPTNPNIIYILTGDADGVSGALATLGGLNKYSTGVLKSIDGGITWNLTGLNWSVTEGIRAYELKMNPDNPNILFVSTGGSIYRTTNGGTTWSVVYSGMPIYDMEFKPGNPDYVYASSNRHFLRSNNAGSSFDTTEVLPALPFGSHYDGMRTSIAVSSNQPAYVYVLAAPTIDTTGSNPTFRGLFLSTNSGASFGAPQCTSPSVFASSLTGNTDQSGYDNAIAANPLAAGTVLCGGIRLFRSTNFGVTMNFINNTGAADYHVDIHDLAYNPLDNKLYMCSDGGVYVSSDNGTTWFAATTSMQITQYYKFSNSISSPDDLVAGSQDNGSHLRNGPGSFSSIYGKDGMDCAMHPTNSNIFYVSAQNGDFQRTTNGGTTLTQILSGDNRFLWLCPLAMDPNNPNTLYTIRGIGGSSKSINAGTTFTLMDLGFGDDDPLGANIKVAKSNSNVVYAALYSYEDTYNNLTSRLYRSGDAGLVWDLIWSSTNKIITDVAINADNENEIWISFGGYEEDEKILHSSNAGVSWNNETGSLPNVPVNCIAFDDNNGAPADALYIGTDIGVFYRDDNLGDWIPFSNFLPVVEVTDLEVLESSGLLRASTYGRGIWQTSLYSAVCASSYNFIASSHPPSEPGFYSATNTITSGALITGAGAHLQYKAGQRITMNPGFRIDASTGSKFIGYLGPCPGGGVPPVYTRTTFNGLPGLLNE